MAVQVFINAHKNSKTTCTSIEFLNLCQLNYGRTEMMTICQI